MDNNYGGYEPTPSAPEKKGFAIAALVLGIVGLLAWCLPILGYPVAIVGIIMGILGLKKTSMKGMCIAGIVMSGICLVASLVNSIAGVMMAVSSFQ